MTSEKRRCPARSKRTGDQCKQWLPEGWLVCRFHGGAAPHVKAAAERRAAMQRAEAEIERLGVPVETDPHDALLGLVWEWAGVVAFLRSKVQRLRQGWVGRVYAEDPDADGDSNGIISEPGEGIVGPNHLGDGAAHVYLVLYGEACDKLAKYSKMAIDAGIAERQVKIAETQAEMFAAAIRGILGDLQIPASPEVLGVVRKHLTLVAAT